MISMLQESGKDFHHPSIELALAVRQRVPVLHVGVMTRQGGIGGNNAHFLLLGEYLFAIGIPAIVKLPLIFIRPLLGDMVWRMLCPWAEVHEEGLVGSDLLGVGNHALGLFHQIRR